MRARLSGLGLPAMAVVCALIVYGVGLRTMSRVILGVPFFGATGIWLLAFGYPVRPDGLTPGWWRLGLVGLVLALTIATGFTLD
jgi:hypothetical protein